MVFRSPYTRDLNASATRARGVPQERCSKQLRDEPGRGTTYFGIAVMSNCVFLLGGFVENIYIWHIWHLAPYVKKVEFYCLFF